MELVRVHNALEEFSIGVRNPMVDIDEANCFSIRKGRDLSIHLVYHWDDGQVVIARENSGHDNRRCPVWVVVGKGMLWNYKKGSVERRAHRLVTWVDPEDFREGRLQVLFL